MDQTLSEKLKLIFQNHQQQITRIEQAECHTPFAILGNLNDHHQDYLIFYAPGSRELTVTDEQIPTHRLQQSDFFVCLDELDKLQGHYRVNRTDSHKHTTSYYDPYTFAAQISDFDLHLFAQGKHLHCYRFLGANQRVIDGIEGVLFATWAPNAGRVSVVGDFNQWDGRTHPMTHCGSSGIWELFIPGLDAGTVYKFELKNREHGTVMLKADPYARQSELRPRTASVVPDNEPFNWTDDAWMDKRKRGDWLHQPLSIYECHLGSWQRDEQNRFLNYQELAHRLVPYVKEMGFTHIELLPITEHPLDASWGYQTTGYFSPTARFGQRQDFLYFVNYCHQHDIGIILDWVPAHFPKDQHGLARFDGTALYEHEDPRLGEHRDWGTLIYNYGRNEVKNFLISNAVFWLEEYHLDGLRVDAVASMLYLDYSRNEGEWLPNRHGGNENLEAIEFLKYLNQVTHERFPGTITLAEESTSWPQVTRPTDVGGLGFSMKWNMGWMHDTLNYFSNDPVYRQHHHNQLTFGLLYLFSENFCLPFSHDEVVHGKKSLINKMPGDEWQRYANLRLLYTYMFTYPGKKLLFMGSEFAQGDEWNNDKPLDWYVLQYPHHSGIKKLVSDLNRLYRQHPALHQYDFDYQGFEWVSCEDSKHSVLSYFRKSNSQQIMVILNFTPVIRTSYPIMLQQAGTYKVIFNSDSKYYAGSEKGSHDIIESQKNDDYHLLSVTLPPLAGLVLEKI